ncbi:hypothetical protein [Dermatophilus congolensis]|uniref:hypothetical protein n=1 Tax=Dermatophilus congolensis TaxID=1863 RepID=UPI000E0FA788|nr:hypothetical protein [Dermatophilus congolensis]
MTPQKPAQQHQPHTPLPGERLRRAGRVITLTALLLLLTSGLGIGYALLQINDDHINELVNEKSAHITQGHAEITHGGRQIILAEKHETTCTVHSSSGSPIPVNPGKSHVKGDGKATSESEPSKHPQAPTTSPAPQTKESSYSQKQQWNPSKPPEPSPLFQL